jgi:hypothetical protein
MQKKRRQSRSSKLAIIRRGGLPSDYQAFLDDLKSRIRTAQIRAALAVNRELIQLYWEIGRGIVHKQDVAGWGNGVVERLASDLQQEFPGITGFSASNVWRMRAFYRAIPMPP